MQSLQGLVATLLWATLHGYVALCEQVAHYFAIEAPKGAHLLKLLDVQARGRHTNARAWFSGQRAQHERGIHSPVPVGERVGGWG